MDFMGAIRLLLRRWYVVVPTMLVSAALAAVTFFSIPTSYQSNGVMVLTSPAAGPSFSALVKPEDVPRVNPLLAFDSSLSTTAQIVIQVLRDPATAADIGIGEDSDLKFDVNTGDLPGPFIFVEVTGSSAQQVRDTVGRILDRAQSELASRQRALDAPEQTFITAQMLVQPTEPTPLIGGKARFTAAALLLGGILTLTAPFAFESITARRSGRRPEWSRAGNDPAFGGSYSAGVNGNGWPGHGVPVPSSSPGGPPAVETFPPAAVAMPPSGAPMASVGAPADGAVPPVPLGSEPRSEVSAVNGVAVPQAAVRRGVERPRPGRRPAPRLRPDDPE